MSETSRSPIDAGVTHALADAALPEWIMWMPAGDHQIVASKRGKPFRLRMQVDAGTAATMQQTLSEYLAEGRQRPFLDFDHERKAASGWPLEFAWRESPEPGVWCRVDWSEAGKAAITGRSYRSFSPSFYETPENPSRVEGAPLCMGSLLNNPAFEDITPIWSGRGDQAAHQTDTHTHTMPITESELAALRARNTELEGKVTELQAAAADEEREAAVEAAKHENDTLKAELSKLKEAVEARSKRDADAVVASAVARGVIPSKDEAAQTKWRELILKDPANADLLNKQPGKAAVTAGRITKPSVQIVKEDTNDVLRAYVAAGTPREKGEIYRADIAKRIDAGENVLARYPVEATNVLGTLANAIVSQRVLELMYSKRPMLRGVVTDFSDEVKSLNDTVKTRTIGLPTMQNFGTAATDTADTDVTVTLDLFKQVLYSFTASELVGTSRNLVAERAEALAISLGNGMVDALAALITEVNFGTTNQTIQATAGVSYDTIVAINQAMNTAAVPDMGRFAWVNAAVAAALSNDTLVIEHIDKTPVANAYAHWRNIKGFENIWEFPALPANSINLTGFFASRSALVIAARIPRNPSEIVGAQYPGTLQVVTDPVTGLSVLRNEWIDGSTWAVNSRLISLFGVDVGQAGCGHTLVSAA